MAFKEISLVLTTSEQDIVVVEADRQGIAKLQVANNDTSNRTFTLKHYKADGATTITVRDAFAVNTKSYVEVPPITMNEGDKLIALASVNSVVVVTGAFHDTAKAVPFAVAGLDGTDPGYPWTFRDKTDIEEPDAIGDLNFNNSSLASVTKIALSAASAGAGNPDLSDVIESWDDNGESANRGRLLLKNRNAPAQTAEFRLTGTVTAHDSTIDWYELDVEFIGGPGLATDAEISVQFYDAGQEGAAGVTGASSLTKVDVVDTEDGDPATEYEDGDTIDGVTLVTNMLVLRASSADPEKNGVYVVPVSGAASRHSDFDDFDDLPGSEFNVIAGTTYGGTKWRCNDEKGGTIDTDPVTIDQVTSMDGAQNLADVADALTAFNNIKQAATDAATGVTRYSTITEAKERLHATSALTPAGFAAAHGVSARGYIYGLTLSNNTTDATNYIDIAAGQAVSVHATDPILMTLASALTKRLDEGWAPGTNQGMRTTAAVTGGATIANTTYHIFLATKAAGADADIYADPSASEATALSHLQAETGGADYIHIRRIGSIRRESNAIFGFKQYGSTIIRSSIALDRNSASATTNSLLTLSVPAGIVVRPIFSSYLGMNSASAGQVLCGSGHGSTADTLVQLHGTGASTFAQRQTALINGTFFTNTSGQIYITVSALSGSIEAHELRTIGWIDPFLGNPT